MKRMNERLAYPETRIDSVRDTLTGVSFPDPYRWLEQDNEEVRRWQHAQAKLASSHVREWGHFDRLRRLIGGFNTERRVVLPRFAGGRWFRTDIPEGASQAQALVADEPIGPGWVFFDP